MNPRCLRCESYDVEVRKEENNTYFRCEDCETEWMEPVEEFKGK